VHTFDTVNEELQLMDYVDLYMLWPQASARADANRVAPFVKLFCLKAVM